MNKFDAKELYIRLTSIQRIDSGPAREKIKDWVQSHRDAAYQALEMIAAAEHRMTFVASTFCGRFAINSGANSFDAFSPVEISIPLENSTLDYMWLTEEALYVRVEVNDYYRSIVETIAPADREWRGEGVGPFWKAVVDEFVDNNIEEFGGELQVMKDRVCLMFRFRKDIPDFITPHPKG